MEKYIILNTRTGKAVQNWSFADKKHIVYCNSPEWAMKWDNEKSANERKEYLEKNFPGQILTVMKMTKTVSYTFG
jgi:hypothetical protein